MDALTFNDFMTVWFVGCVLAFVIRVARTGLLP